MLQANFTACREAINSSSCHYGESSNNYLSSEAPPGTRNFGEESAVMGTNARPAGQ